MAQATTPATRTIEDEPAVVNEDGTPTEATISMLRPAPRTTREGEIKAKQDAERKRTRGATPKAAGKAKARKATRTAKATTEKKATPAKDGMTKADRVRALLDQGKSVKEIAAALDDVSWSYAWDIAAAYEKKTGKVFIASHAKQQAKSKVTTRTAQA